MDGTVPTNKQVAVGQPPFDCMHEVVQKMQREPVNMILLVPYWPRQAWFSLLERMATNSFFIYRSETEYKPKPGLPTPPASEMGHSPVPGGNFEERGDGR